VNRHPDEFETPLHGLWGGPPPPPNFFAPWEFDCVSTCMGSDGILCAVLSRLVWRRRCNIHLIAGIAALFTNDGSARSIAAGQGKPHSDVSATL